MSGGESLCPRKQQSALLKFIAVAPERSAVSGRYLHQTLREASHSPGGLWSITPSVSRGCVPAAVIHAFCKRSRLFLYVLERIKVKANKRDVPYQSLIKAWLAEDLAQAALTCRGSCRLSM